MNRRLTAALAVLLLATGSAAAQQSTARVASITVQGEGRAEVPPDHVKLSADIVTKGKTLEAATAAHRERTTKAANLLRDMEKDGLKIERSTFRLDHNRTPVQAGQKSPEPEFHAVTSFSLKSDRVGAVDQLVTAIAESGLFEIQNLRFGIDDRNPGVAAARRDAVNDARERAKTYAEAAGVQLGEIMDMSDISPRILREMGAPMTMRTSVQVAPPEAMTLTASITMTWRLVAGP